MKYLKMLVIAIVAIFTFGSAQAQVVVRARVGGPVHRRHYYHHRPYHHYRHHRFHHRY